MSFYYIMNEKTGKTITVEVKNAPNSEKRAGFNNDIEAATGIVTNDDNREQSLTDPAILASSDNSSNTEGVNENENENKNTIPASE